jgi:hypothetical protein
MSTDLHVGKLLKAIINGSIHPKAPSCSGKYLKIRKPLKVRIREIMMGINKSTKSYFDL